MQKISEKENGRCMEIDSDAWTVCEGQERNE